MWVVKKMAQRQQFTLSTRHFLLYMPNSKNINDISCKKKTGFTIPILPALVRSLPNPCCLEPTHGVTAKHACHAEATGSFGQNADASAASAAMAATFSDCRGFPPVRKDPESWTSPRGLIISIRINRISIPQVPDIWQYWNLGPQFQLQRSIFWLTNKPFGDFGCVQRLEQIWCRSGEKLDLFGELLVSFASFLLRGLKLEKVAMERGKLG